MGDISIKNNLRRIRRANSDYTQEQLAAIACCTRQTIIALEQNKYNPSLALALKIANALDAKVEDIFYLEEE
jgi:DNA-binding XRE family transcriptional regulator